MSKTTPKKMARLVNASLSNHSFRVLTEQAESEGRYFRTIKLKPLAATVASYDLGDPQIAALLTRPAVGREEVRQNPALRQRRILIPMAEPGTEITSFTAMGNTYKTCKVQGSVADGTKQVDPREIHLSVFQAQQLLLSLSDIPRIEFYLRIDERPMVQTYGRDLLLYRKHNLELAEKGIDPVRGRQAVTQSAESGFHVDLGI
jgi:hypothetical protein